MCGGSDACKWATIEHVRHGYSCRPAGQRHAMFDDQREISSMRLEAGLKLERYEDEQLPWMPSLRIAKQSLHAYSLCALSVPSPTRSVKKS